jgi:CBS domain containing-hemolysin-like protein
MKTFALGRLSLSAKIILWPFGCAVLGQALAQTSEAPIIPLNQILTLLILLVLSGIFSGAETALTAIGEWKIRQLQEEGKDKSGVFALLQRDRTRFITTLLIGNNLVNIAATALVTQIAIRLSSALGFAESLAVGYATGVMTLLVLIFGEITPKSLAVHNAVAFSRFVIRPVYTLSIVLYPIGLFFTWLTGNILRLFRLEPRLNPLMTENELRLMLRSAEESGVIEEQEQEMIKGIIELEETVVREIMTPRVDMVAISMEANLVALLELAQAHNYSRLPVYNETIDNIKGIVYARDLLNYLGRPEALRDTQVSALMTPPQYIPETLNILTLLKDMRLRKNHMAIVVDEFGGTAGLVTLEDIIEEITGEIYDETDKEEVAEIEALGDRHYRMQASVHLDEAAEALGITFEDDGEYDTLAGFLISQFGYIPQIGETLEYENLRFMIEAADERRVSSVLVSPIEAQPEAASTISEITN